MHKNAKSGFYKFVIITFLILSTSCVPVKKLSYFNDIDNLEEPVFNPRGQKVIMPHDKLYIKVLSIDERTNQLFNTNEGVGGGNSTSIIGYLVDENGNINFPYVGKIQVINLTTDQAGKKIEESLGVYLSNAAVNVKFIDNNVTVMGEVQRQGMYSFSQDKLTIYEALALGGGVSRYGDRTKVVLIRQEGDKILHYKMNLTNSKITDKEYYYIHPNDVIVVEPMKNISASYGNNTYSIFLSTISALFTILMISGVQF